MQKAQAEQRKELFAKKNIQTRLVSLKSKLEQFEEKQQDSSAAQKKQVKIVAELDRFLKLISLAVRG
jgi:hypothetical protein